MGQSEAGGPLHLDRTWNPLWVNNRIDVGDGRAWKLGARYIF